MRSPVGEEKGIFRTQNATKHASLVAITILAAGLILTGYGLMIPIKAWMSVHLLDRAWARVLAGEDDVRPWPWMDSEPVARLFVTRKDRTSGNDGPSFVVMRGVSGSVLAFAPGWHEQTVLPGHPGTSLISAHRDTHFAMLQGIGEGDRFMIEDRQGRQSLYEVDKIVITDNPTLALSKTEEQNRLLLVTCYPLNDWHPNSRQRLVVVANEVPEV